MMQNKVRAKKLAIRDGLGGEYAPRVYGALTKPQLAVTGLELLVVQQRRAACSSRATAFPLSFSQPARPITSKVALATAIGTLRAAPAVATATVSSVGAAAT